MIRVGLMVSSFSITQQQALPGAFFFTVPSPMLSGFVTAIQKNMPPLIQDMTYLNPIRYFLIIVSGVCLKEHQPGRRYHNSGLMLLIGVAKLAIAGWLLRRRRYRVGGRQPEVKS